MEEDRGKMLIQAAIYDNTDLMQCLLEGEERKYLNTQDACGRTPVYTAVSNKSVSCLELLLQAGANPDIAAGRKFDCMTPLSAAAVEGKVDCLTMLLEYGADPDKKDASGLTALEMAEVANNQRCIDAFHEARAKRDHNLQHLANDLLKLCSIDNDDVDGVTNLLNQLGSRAKEFINVCLENEESTLYRACRHNLVNVVSLLLDAGADPYVGKSPLYVACSFNCVQIAKLLLEKCPKIVNKQMPDCNGCQLPIHAACSLGDVEMVDILLNFDYPDEAKNTYLHTASGLEYKAAFDINTVDVSMQTPLYYACLSDNSKAVACLLLDHQVSALKSNTEVLYSRESKDESVSNDNEGQDDSEGSGSANEDLEDTVTFNPVVIDCKSADGTTPLIAAARLDLKEVVKLLVHYKADINATFRNKSGKYSALLEACEQGDISRMRVLLDLGAKDDDLRCLMCAQLGSNDNMTSTLLRYRTYQDMEHKINREALRRLIDEEQAEEFIDSVGSIKSLGSGAIKAPMTPVFINWYQLNLPEVRNVWLLNVCYYHNSKLPIGEDCHPFALFALTKIDISNNTISQLPTKIFGLQSLQVLNAANNKIRSLVSPGLKLESGALYWQLPTLRVLNLRENLLENLPCELFTKTALDRLDVSHNKLVSVPVEMWSGAKEIDLSYNHLENLPEQNRDELSFSFDGKVPMSPHCTLPRTRPNDEVDAEDSFSSTQTVVKNNIWKVYERDTDEDSYQNTPDKQLKELTLSHNCIKCLPSSFPCIAPYLEKLYLSHNKLVSAGVPMNYPSSLKYLDLSHNEITMPVHFSEAKDTQARRPVSTLLQSCSLEHSVASSPGPRTGPFRTDICHFHQKHKDLKHLKTLNLSHNKIEKLVFYDGSTGGLNDGGLTFSSDSLNPRTNPATLFYPVLSHLDVSSNNLQDVPPLLGELTSLGVLQLGHNSKITKLPPELGRLRKLWTLDVKDCPLEGPLKALFERPNVRVADITGFLKSILKRDEKFQRMKLMFVGIQGIGKTSLLQQLRYKNNSTTDCQEFGERTRVVKSKKKIKGEKQLSTVGVDIGLLPISGKKGTVTFSTWDFGGQKEYYATHQYFLSRRALYLLMWKLTDGEKAIYEMKQWLINIQMRAPNSVVIIVGTHLDHVKKKSYPKGFLKNMQDLIETTFIKIPDPASKGYPRVVKRIEVNLGGGIASKSFVSELSTIIYDEAWKIKEPGSKTLCLLDQKVPASYVELGDIVTKMAQQKRDEKKQPVLTKAEYDNEVMLHDPAFDDKTPLLELHQATQFLHENGVLLHYSDVGLKNLYFLDPQWLCDLLAHVVTVREVNSVHKYGNMLIEDLSLLFKGEDKDPSFRGPNVQKYIINLLHKFEVALSWNQENLLIPSLLPTENQLALIQPTPKIPLLGNTIKTTRTPCKSVQLPASIPYTEAHSTFYRKLANKTRIPGKETYIPEQHEDWETKAEHASFTKAGSLNFKFVPNLPHALHRLILMAYFPSGFWSRLMTRLLGDEPFASVIKKLYKIPPHILSVHTELGDWLKEFNSNIHWECWQTGVRLMFRQQTIVQVKQVLKEVPGSDRCVYHHSTIKVLAQREHDHSTDEDDVWEEQSLKELSLLEIQIPNATVVFMKKGESKVPTEKLIELHQELSILSQQAVTDEAAIAELMQRVDENEKSMRFLEDSLKVAVERIQDADRIMEDVATGSDHSKNLIDESRKEKEVAMETKKRTESKIKALTDCVQQMKVEMDLTKNRKEASDRRRVEIRKVIPDVNNKDNLAELEVKIEPNIHDATNLLNKIVDHIDTLLEDWFPDIGSRFARSTQGIFLISRLAPCKRCLIEVTDKLAEKKESDTSWNVVDLDEKESPLVTRNVTTPCEEEDEGCVKTEKPVLCCFMLELCMLYSYKQTSLKCEIHGEDTGDIHVAPDLVFHDLVGDGKIIPGESFERDRLLGHGAFGFVFSGKIKDEHKPPIDVAMKMLEPPADPGDNINEDDKHYLQAIKQKWKNNPLPQYCDAYTMIRREVGIMLAVISHDNIVSLLGVSMKPLGLVLELAPLGALDGVLNNYKRNDTSLPLNAVKNIILQIGSAIDFLHSNNIIYRDLKAENVFVWHMPDPRDRNPAHSVCVKLGDYGISRLVIQAGTRGSAGTPPYMAPEIIEFAGNETYSDKADCYSFGIFIYELLSLKLPFHEYSAANLRSHVISGGRPAISSKEARSPTNILDLMVMCWSEKPTDRPSASEIVRIASCQEFCHLKEAIPLPPAETISALGGPSVLKPLNVTCACSVIKEQTPLESCPPEIEDYFEEEKSLEMCKSEVWVAGYVGCFAKIQVISYENAVCSDARTLECNFDAKIMHMCMVGSCVWLADSLGYLHVLSTQENCKEILKFQITKKNTVSIEDMFYVKELEEVYIGLSNGTVHVCCAKSGVDMTQIIKHTVHAGKQLYCCALLNRGNGKSELWCGQKSGYIEIIETSSYDRVIARTNHYEPVEDEVDVNILVTSPTMPNSVWSYVYPGFKVFHWDAESRKISSILNCSKAIPHVDKLRKSYRGFDGTLEAVKCQVTAMNMLYDQVYVGTMWGCIIVADKMSLRPLAVFRCHGEESFFIKAILPITPCHDDEADDIPGSQTSNRTPHHVVSFGKQYRPLRSDHVILRKSAWSSEDLSKPHLLTWLAEDWKYY